MRRSGPAILTIFAAAFLVFGVPSRLFAASPPVVSTVLFGRTAGTDQQTVTLIGKSLTGFTSFGLFDTLDEPVDGPVVAILRSRRILVLALPDGLVPGRYVLTAGGARVVKQYFTVDILAGDYSAPGTLNGSDNPVDWTRLKGVPAGFADGTDDDTPNVDAWTESGSDAYRAAGRVGIGTTSPAATIHVSGDDGALFEGTPDSGGIPAEGPGVRMMWYPGKGAFRAGHAVGTEWDDANVGPYSVATGYDTSASGYASTATGYGTTASGPNSTALGWDSIASGDGSTALGVDAEASGRYSIAMGLHAVASGHTSTAIGLGATASGIDSIAIGSSTSASGGNSTSMGYDTTASGGASTATGGYTVASGDFSLACGAQTVASGRFSASFGLLTEAQPFASVTLGQFNIIGGTTNSWVSTDPVLVVGNGVYQSPSNAFTLLKNGNLTIAGTLTQNSDERLKKEIAPLQGVLRRIAAIRGVAYRLKDEERGPAGTQIGLLAQEVRAVFPELVHEDSQGTLSVAYGNFSAVLLEAVKEQQAALDARDRELAALKKEIAETRAATEERLSRLEKRLSSGATGDE